MSIARSKTFAAATLAIILLSTGTGARAQVATAPADRPEDRVLARALGVPDDQERADTRLEGVIQHVDESRTLVEFSVGSGGNVVAGRTVMVYRLSPAPRYIGSFVIVATRPGRGLGVVLDRRPDQEIEKGDRIIEARPKGRSFQVLPL